MAVYEIKIFVCVFVCVSCSDGKNVNRETSKWGMGLLTVIRKQKLKDRELRVLLLYVGLFGLFDWG